LKMSERKIRTCLDKLKTLENLTIKPTNKYSIITINNWHTYQQQEFTNDQQNDQLATSRRPAGDHKQECKNVRREEEETLLSPSNFDSSKNGIPAKTISEAWNSFVKQNSSSMPQVAKISPSTLRYRHIKARWKDYPDLETWNTVMEKATRSPFLNGRVNKFCASFDWIVKSQDNFTKVLEGNYDNKDEQTMSGMTLDEFRVEFNMEINSLDEIDYWIKKGTIRADQRKRLQQ
jgi:hypothetical protein